MRIASVIVDIPARALDRCFDYLVPTVLDPLSPGCAVSVEFGNRPAVGYVAGVVELDLDEQASMDVDKMKPLLGVLSEPYFDELAVKLMFWIAREYLCPLSDALHLFTPPGGSPKMKRVDGAWRLVHPGVGPVDDRWVFLDEGAKGFAPAANASKQRSVLAALENGGMRVAELSLELGNVNAVLSSLEKRGVVRIERRRRIRDVQRGVAGKASSVAALTAGQEQALAAIEQQRSVAEHGAQRVVVVDGITGSGKTEVYLRAIESALGRGKGALVLVPEISLTPQTVGRFRARFGDDVAVLHSRLSVGERFDQWDLVRQGSVHVVVGTRSALFAPLANIGLIIIDEEHEDTYKQESSPRYHAVSVAVQMAMLRDAVLVLGSATPSITTLAACGQAGGLARGWQHASLPQRPNKKPLPPVTVVDMGKEFSQGSRSMFSAELIDALGQVHDRGEKAVLMLNKRGFASFVLCRECGYVPECPECAVSLTYHERGSYLACHHCEHVEQLPARCPKCGSPYLRKFGAGTERVEAELASIVADDMPIVRMDADTVKGKGAHERLLEEFSQARGGILLGTQMIAKGLDFPDVTLVGVINADTTLRLPDFRASERTYQLLEQVSGRAGRADKPGRVIVQTYSADNPAIRAAAAHDRRLFLDSELPQRAELAYPPYSRLANILVWGKRERPVRSEAAKFALALDSALASAGLDWMVLGPSPCLLERLRSNWRWHILIKAPRDADFSQVLLPLLQRRGRSEEGVRLAVDVDPVNLF